MRRTIPNPKPNNRFLYLSLLIAVLVIGFKLYKQHLRGTSVSETGALPGSLQFSPDSRLLAYVDGGGVRDPMSRPQNRLLLWSFQAPPRVLFATNGLISRPQFSHDGTLVASVCIDPGIIHAGTPALLKLEMIVKIWNVKSGALVRSLDAGSEPNAAKLWFTPDDKHLIVIGSVTKSFDLATGNVARSLTLPGECMQAEFSEADNLLYCTAMDEKKPGETRLLVWNAATGNVVQRMDDPKAINFIPIPSAGKAVIQETINDDCQEGGLTLIKLSSGTRESLPAGLVTTAIADQRGTRIYVARGKPASTNDDCGVYGEHGAIIGAIDAKTGKAVWEQPVPENLQDVLISPDSKFLIGYGFLEHPDNATIRMFDAATGRQITAVQEMKDQMVDAAISPNGQWLATATDTDVNLRDTRDLGAVH